MRILHFSDYHIEGSLERVPLRELCSKKLIGLANLELLRRRRFVGVERKLEELHAFATRSGVDLAICTGDHTALGTEDELARARRAMNPFEALPLGLVTMPGNHDLYLPGAVRDRRFERHFADLLGGGIASFRTDELYPWVRFFGDHLAVVIVNSARPNPQPWRSSGRIPDAQIAGLRRVFGDPDVRARFVLVATHYAPRLANGRPDTHRHGLVNGDAFLAACRDVASGAVIHGHVHHCFHVEAPEAGLSLFGAGSATEKNHEGFWLFDVDGSAVVAHRGCYRLGTGYTLTDQVVRLSPGPPRATARSLARAQFRRRRLGRITGRARA